MKNLFTNSSLYILQTKLVSPNSQGNSRWTVVNPSKSALYGAIGKDEYPKLIKILKNASSTEGVSLDNVDVLTDKQLLFSDSSYSATKKKGLFLDYYHEFVHGYTFYNYESLGRFEKDREQMDEYRKISPHPTVYSDRNHELPRFTLPSPQMQQCEIASEAQLLSNILSGTFLAVGEIDGGDSGPWLRKASPSGGARHPTEALVVIKGIENLPDGIYYYDPPKNQLVFKSANSDKNNKRNFSLIITARVERPMWRYRESRSFRAIFLDAGHCIETLRQLSVAYGWSLVEDFIIQDLFEELDLQDIPICGFSINRLVDGMALPASSQSFKNKVLCESKEVDSDTHYNTNPFLWCYFRGGELIGISSYPRYAKLSLDDSMFKVLNYAQISRRGDRPSTPAEISESQEVSIKLVENLISSGFLLERESVRSLYMKAAHWISYGWYQNLLVYLEYRSKKTNSESLIGQEFFHNIERADSSSLWDALSKERKTTRAFTTEVVDDKSALDAVTPCLDLLNSCNALELFHLKRVGENFFDMEMWSKKKKHFISFKRVSSSLLVDAVIGQKPVVQASDIYWFAGSVDGLSSVEYMNTLLRLGILMQKICISCASMRLGLFITPATNDLAAAKVSELDSLFTINYFAAIGYSMRK
ncbi:SagB/ThcOx family dehydrogenase [Pseudomonas syringae]|uniref:SagB/ThcOx family dehydrogenase n=1 Tax=Pseudomonas syringae TaxID=317 RepID=UPI0023F82066|nr:SagB/ThcOx family dehydrogenase [Pseudomonas syringae]MDF7793107.1 SagB/ThcOx family dehydrogenase [Pseudomonas syringae]